MYGDPALGEATEQDHEDARAALDAAAHIWDLDAARRARPPGAPGEGPDGYGSLLRGGPLPHPEHATAAAPDGPAPEPPADPAEWARVLGELIAGRIPALLVVEFAADNASVVHTRADANGIPARAKESTAEWRTIVPELHPEDDIRRFQLAGGIGSPDPVDREQFDRSVARWLSAALTVTPDDTVVLVCSRPGWTLLDRAAEVLRSRHRVPVVLHRAPSAERPGERARGLLRSAPLLTDHVLLLARVDPGTGRVRLDERVLFRAGTVVPRPDGIAVRVAVHGGVTDNGSAALPLVARARDTGLDDATVLALHGLELPAHGTAWVTYVLRGPGEIEALGADGTPLPRRAAPATDMAALTARVSGRVVPPPPLDLVCAVEMAGATEEETAERVAFLRELIGHLTERRQQLRVGALGYYDHVSRNRYARAADIVVSVSPAAADRTLAAVARWRPAPRVRDSAAALEDALQAAVPMTAGRPRRGGPQKVLLVLGRRPPGLPGQVGLIPACTYGIDWRVQVGRLRAQGVRVVARADPPTTPPSGDRTGLALQRHTDESWRELAAGGSFRPGTDSARDVARALAPPWRMEGPSCPLAFAEPLTPPAA
ncbi:hypothetical protein WN71_018690 [Streptomyces mangrovisoli]|uniref:Uncharacterized protein n=1 Tax=Streptomyces mangrovisoli TaxID=1428628 RepID=A0A1J4NY20_9ACTN|nr:hypothetical protein WN71_018690 [Streptomyces mangrovisoli]